MLSELCKEAPLCTPASVSCIISLEEIVCMCLFLKTLHVCLLFQDLYYYLGLLQQVIDGIITDITDGGRYILKMKLLVLAAAKWIHTNMFAHSLMKGERRLGGDLTRRCSPEGLNI